VRVPCLPAGRDSLLPLDLKVRIRGSKGSPAFEIEV